MWACWRCLRASFGPGGLQRTQLGIEGDFRVLDAESVVGFTVLSGCVLRMRASLLVLVASWLGLVYAYASTDSPQDALHVVFSQSEYKGMIL